MEGLAIATGAVALAQVCLKLSVKVTSFISNARTVDDDVRGLSHGLNALSEVLISVSQAWTDNPEISITQTGSYQALWGSVNDSISGCSAVLKRFEQLLSTISVDEAAARNMFKRSFTKIKLELIQSHINGCQAEVDVYFRVLTFALLNLNICTGIRRDGSDEVVIQKLDAIGQDIETLLQKLSSEPDCFSNLDPDTTSSLNSVIRAAQDLKSSITENSGNSEGTVRGGDTTEQGTSALGEPLSKERADHIGGWISTALDKRAESPIANTASSSGWSEPLQDVDTLPQLMSVIENMSEMFKRHEAIEQQKIFAKDEEIRILQQRYEKTKVERDEALLCKETLEETQNDLKKELENTTNEFAIRSTQVQQLEHQLEGLTSGNVSLQEKNITLEKSIVLLEREIKHLRNATKDYSELVSFSKESEAQLERWIIVATQLSDKEQALEVALSDQRKRTRAAEEVLERLESLMVHRISISKKFIRDSRRKAKDFTSQLASMSTTTPVYRKVRGKSAIDSSSPDVRTLREDSLLLAPNDFALVASTPMLGPQLEHELMQPAQSLDLTFSFSYFTGVRPQATLCLLILLGFIMLKFGKYCQSAYIIADNYRRPNKVALWNDTFYLAATAT